MLDDKADNSPAEDDSIQIWHCQYYGDEDKKYKTVNIMMVNIEGLVRLMGNGD